ncbi:MAG TPA: hemerythrin domain-containing protein [Rhodanobacter sp.]|jgi:iron-sulfur cluster repair protein YtfE (RIC family)|nr:hemerythrin domain-containing protein [Rhodanobacter sp.]
MSRTARFREQHVEILRLAAELQRIPEPQLRENAGPARKALSNLLGKLTLHLAVEDRSVYPQLQSSPNAAVANMAKRFEQEMGGIAAKVQAWGNSWPTPGAIQADPRRFITETADIITILKQRMQRENLELYAAADAI